MNRPDDTPRPERGMTLIEMVITVAIVSIAFVAVLTALGAMITTGALHRQLTRSEAAARNVAEYVKRPSVTYAPCAGSYDFSSLSGSGVLPAGYSASSTVKVVDDVMGATATYTSLTCPGTDNGVQKVTVVVCPHGEVPCTTSRDDAQSLPVVKRRPIT